MDNSLGFTIDIHGPCSLRRNDLRLFRESNINERMRNAGDWIIFGDSAYKDHSNCKSYRSGDREFNHAMKSVRISIEWSYMTAGSLFSPEKQEQVGIIYRFPHFYCMHVAEKLSCVLLRQSDHELLQCYFT